MGRVIRNDNKLALALLNGAQRLPPSVLRSFCAAVRKASPAQLLLGLPGSVLKVTTKSILKTPIRTLYNRDYRNLVARGHRMKIWYREVSSWSREMIQHSINNAAWQRFRISLKGLSTEDKLESLETYCQNREKDGNRMSMEDQCRVDNYINALLRGGQLKRGSANIVVQR